MSGEPLIHNTLYSHFSTILFIVVVHYTQLLPPGQDLIAFLIFTILTLSIMDEGDISRAVKALFTIPEKKDLTINQITGKNMEK